MNVGTLCIKLAGRDAGKRCVILNTAQQGRVLIDGETRRRECNIHHLQSLNQIVSVNENAPHDDVIAAFKAVGIVIVERRARTTQVAKSTGKPVPHHARKQKPVKTASPKSAPARVAKQKKVVSPEVPAAY